jgi:hypothetical protein
MLKQPYREIRVADQIRGIEQSDFGRLFVLQLYFSKQKNASAVTRTKRKGLAELFLQ